MKGDYKLYSREMLTNMNLCQNLFAEIQMRYHNNSILKGAK